MEKDKEADIERLVEHIHRISHRLMFLFDMFEKDSSENLKNLSNIEMSVIFKLYKNPQIIMRDLSEDLHVSKSSITGIVDHLEELGYLRRMINRNDRRSFELEITEKGKLLQLQHEKYEKQAYLQLIKAMNMCGISEAYLDQTDRLLDYMEKP